MYTVTVLGPCWDAMIEFVAGVVAMFRIGQTDLHARVSVTTFGQGAFNHFYFNQHMSNEDVHEEIVKMLWGDRPRGTYTKQGLKMVKEFATESKGMRAASKGIPRVVIVITDGRSTHGMQGVDEAAALKAMGAKVFAVGVGGYDADELENLASSPSSTFVRQIADFAGMKRAINSVVQTVCTVVTGMAGSGTSAPAVRCDDSPVDMMFLVDDSRSVGTENWNMMLDFVVKVADNFDVGDTSDSTRVGFGTFSSQIGLRLELGFNPAEKSDSTNAGFAAAVKSAPANRYTAGSWTNTASGIEGVGYHLMNIYHPGQTDIGPRPASKRIPKIMIIVTDGGSSRGQSGAAAAQALKDAGTTVIAVGVNGYVQSELDGMASFPIAQHVHTARDFNDLAASVNAVTRSVCDAASSGSGSNSASSSESEGNGSGDDPFAGYACTGDSFQLHDVSNVVTFQHNRGMESEYQTSRTDISKTACHAWCVERSDCVGFHFWAPHEYLRGHRNGNTGGTFTTPSTCKLFMKQDNSRWTLGRPTDDGGQVGIRNAWSCRSRHRRSEEVPEDEDGNFESIATFGECPTTSTIFENFDQEVPEGCAESVGPTTTFTLGLNVSYESVSPGPFQARVLRAVSDLTGIRGGRFSAVYSDAGFVTATIREGAVNETTLEEAHSRIEGAIRNGTFAITNENGAKTSFPIIAEESLVVMVRDMTNEEFEADVSKVAEEEDAATLQELANYTGPEAWDTSTDFELSAEEIAELAAAANNNTDPANNNTDPEANGTLTSAIAVEYEKKKGWIAAVVILLLLVAAAVGFVVVDKRNNGGERVQKMVDAVSGWTGIGAAAQASDGSGGDGSMQVFENPMYDATTESSAATETAAPETAPTGSVYTCDFMCGFKGSFDVVGLHETGCSKNPAADNADAPVGDATDGGYLQVSDERDIEENNNSSEGGGGSEGLAATVGSADAEEDERAPDGGGGPLEDAAEYVALADAAGAGAEDAPVYALPVEETFAGFGGGESSTEPGITVAGTSGDGVML